MKSSKAETNYRKGSATKRCDQCTMWRPPKSCTVVEGDIRPDDLCDLFKRVVGRTEKRFGR